MCGDFFDRPMDLKSRKKRALHGYYSTLERRRYFEQAQPEMISACDQVLAEYLNRLRAIRFQEIYAGWPLIVAPASLN